jgi:hypothetical protein
MPAQLPAAVKALKELIKKELNAQQAVDKYWATQGTNELLSQPAITAKHRIPLSTLTACI